MKPSSFNCPLNAKSTASQINVTKVPPCKFMSSRQRDFACHELYRPVVQRLMLEIEEQVGNRIEKIGFQVNHLKGARVHPSRPL